MTTEVCKGALDGYDDTFIKQQQRKNEGKWIITEWYVGKVVYNVDYFYVRRPRTLYALCHAWVVLQCTGTE